MVKFFHHHFSTVSEIGTAAATTTTDRAEEIARAHLALFVTVLAALMAVVSLTALSAGGPTSTAILPLRRCHEEGAMMVVGLTVTDVIHGIYAMD